ncbi:MAG TPA: glycoside hydrolase family 2 TIM barrel-domain containing protein, partial [Niabella sp.]|nr:glycoside hydrolase family 2 TIM barrel-domain containing protein [Niabella sp.]
MANKSVLLLFIWFLFSFQVNGQSVNDVAREIHLFNFDWKFHYGDAPNAHELIYNDTNWETLDLPHDFQINLPWDSSAGGARGFKEMGIGWYRKIFKADPSWKGKKILLDFEGIMLLGDVWVNGKKVGSTDYGYLGFETDISGFLKYDTENVIAVKASTGSKGGSRWYTGGGLYRDVHLIVKHNVSIARHGIFVTTPRISNNDADIKVQVELEGVKNKMYNLEIEVNLMSPDGIQVASARIPAPKGNKQQTVEVLMPLIKINHPKLWSCEMPNLYMAEVSLILDGKKVDMLKQQFGIRTLMFDKEFGFKLNGEKIFLKGISNHHDLGALGAAAFETAIARQMDQLKAFGFNHIRTSHNPYSPSFLKLADEKGILIVDELYDKWSNKSYRGGRKPWSDLWFEHIKEWIKRDRNHPSVILWSFGNELQMREDLAGYDTGDWGVTTYQMMKVVAHRYDSTRKTTVAMFPARAGGVGKSDPGFNTNIVPPELATVTDIASFNYRWMNYAEYLKHAPNMNIYQSEATTNELAAP